MLEEWTEPPAMSPVAPAPALHASDGTLWLAYRIARDPHHCAVIRFHHVQQHLWGAPPAVHGLESLGDLSPGSFYRVPVTTGDTGRLVRRWLITFPDAILDVRAADGEVVLRAAAALGPAHALAALLT
ncbi:MAG TPA: hypothetical protein VFT84_16375 [Gemmatimonadales bacterium]|nr:hypothetical protein [Gemmatimonadales bacterium]